MRAFFLAPDTVFELSQSINQSINQSIALLLFCRNAPCQLHGETETALAKYTYVKHDCVTHEQIPM